MKPDFLQGPMQPAEPTHCSECDQLIEDCKCGECRCGKWLYEAMWCSVCQKACCPDHCQLEQGTTVCDSCFDEAS
jgi:hypothetical protein